MYHAECIVVMYPDATDVCVSVAGAPDLERLHGEWLDVLYDCCDIMFAVLACGFEGVHWGTVWMYRECPKGEWLVWSLDML